MSGLDFQEGKIPGVKLVKPKAFPDARGYFTETFHIDKYREIGIDRNFVQDNASFSKRHVLRGLHFQKNYPQGKLVFAIVGEIFDVAVDIRPDSPTYGQWDGHILSAENRHQLYVPEGFAHGFVVLSETATVMYKCTDIYRANDDSGIIWNDPDLAIDWPVSEPVLSDKDAVLPRLSER